MAEQEILPCPFCGGECKTTWRSRSDDLHWAVTCYRCWYTASSRKTEAEAIAAHNTVSRNNAAADDMRDILKACARPSRWRDAMPSALNDRIAVALAKGEKT